MARSIFCLLFFVFGFLNHPTIKAEEEKTSTASFPVGELGTRWQFPSDHLPVGASVGGVHFALWNILNTDYLQHIVENGQGLKDSLILEKNIPAEEGKPLTLREQMAIEDVLEMISHPRYPRSVIALQETGEHVYQALLETLPENYKALTAYPDDLAHGDLFLYDTDKFIYKDLLSGSYQSGPSNTWMMLDLIEKSSGLHYRFIQSHVPGGPIKSEPARKELADILFSNYDPQAITIVMGDMNRSPDYFLKNFEEAQNKYGLASQPFFNLWVPYPTHINTHREASWIDNLFIANPYSHLQIAVSKKGTDFFASLDQTLDLLEGLSPKPLRVSQEILNRMDVFGAAVIFGAPGSGKTEQMSLALDNTPIHVFDLRKEFTASFGNYDPEEIESVRKIYQTEAMKDEEFSWIQSSRETLLNKILAEESEAVVFDEFDLAIGQTLNSSEEGTIAEVLKLASEIRKAGKKVIFIIHTAALNAPSFWELMRENFHLQASDIVKTGFLNDREARYLLEADAICSVDEYIQWAQGSPIPYLLPMQDIINKRLPPFAGNNILVYTYSAQEELKKIIKVLLRIEPPETTEALFSIAANKMHIDELDSQLVQKLIHTGLIGEWHGELLMPEFIKKELLKSNPGV